MNNDEKWSHLHQYERKYLKQAIAAYEQIMKIKDDVSIIAIYYQLKIEDVQRAKNYAFGIGVTQYKFSPDIAMVQAWQRMTLRQGTIIDEVFLRHEMLESDLVINQGMNQTEAHKIAQQRYPWSILVKRLESL